MKDELEKLIIDNRQRFNDADLPDGHLDRFRSKLTRSSKRTRFRISTWMKVAAVLVFGLFAYQLGRVAIQKRADVSLSAHTPEYLETERYYTTAINTSLTLWEGMLLSGQVSKAEDDLLQKELVEFETHFRKLQEDFDANPNDERVIHAMIEYYETKLGVISLIIKKLEEKKQLKNNRHEMEL